MPPALWRMPHAPSPTPDATCPQPYAACSMHTLSTDQLSSALPAGHMTDRQPGCRVQGAGVFRYNQDIYVALTGRQLPKGMPWLAPWPVHRPSLRCHGFHGHPWVQPLPLPGMSPGCNPCLE